jgi:hypothetical protein
VFQNKRGSTNHTQHYVLAALVHIKGDVDVRDVEPDGVAKTTRVLLALIKSSKANRRIKSSKANPPHSAGAATREQPALKTKDK